MTSNKSGGRMRARALIQFGPHGRDNTHLMMSDADNLRASERAKLHSSCAPDLPVQLAGVTQAGGFQLNSRQLGLS